MPPLRESRHKALRVFAEIHSRIPEENLRFGVSALRFGSLTSVSAADFAFLIAESDPFRDWWLAVAFVVIGGGIGFSIVWALTRHTRRVAHEQAEELVEVARREAAVAAEELKQKAEAEIQEKRSDLNREFDRREIESDVRLREIRAHE